MIVSAESRRAVVFRRSMLLQHAWSEADLTALYTSDCDDVFELLARATSVKRSLLDWLIFGVVDEHVLRRKS